MRRRLTPEEITRHEGMERERKRRDYGVLPRGRRFRHQRPTLERGASAAGWMLIGLVVTLAAVAAWSALASEAEKNTAPPASPASYSGWRN